MPLSSDVASNTEGGCSTAPTNTAFDPAVHDALMHVDEELAEGTEVTTVVGILQPGYRIGEKILRPARVSVADPK